MPSFWPGSSRSRVLDGRHSLFFKLLDSLRVLGKMSQAHAAQNVRRLRELNVVVADDLDAVAPRIAEVEERPRQCFDARLGQCLANGLLVVDDEPKVATVVRGLSASLLQRQKLVAEVDEGHVLAFPAKIDRDDPS